MKKIVGFTILGIVALVGLGVAALGQAPTAITVRSNNQQAAVTGQPAPAFSLPATNGSTVSLSSYVGKQNVLLYFHEGLTCDPCMQQMPELEGYLSQFSALNVAPLYVAMDSTESMKPAIEKYNLKTPVLSYMKAKTEQDYNLLPYSMDMGRRAGHTFILVGTDGIIKWRKDYWPTLGMMNNDGTMFVPGSEVVKEVTAALGAN